MVAFVRLCQHLHQWFRWIQPLEPALVLAAIPPIRRRTPGKKRPPHRSRALRRRKYPWLGTAGS